MIGLDEMATRALDLVPVNSHFIFIFYNKALAPETYLYYQCENVIDSIKYKNFRIAFGILSYGSVVK